MSLPLMLPTSWPPLIFIGCTNFRSGTRWVLRAAKQAGCSVLLSEDFQESREFDGLDKDILPVRTVYNGTTQNVGINYLTSKEPIWFAGPDLVASILLTGNVPHIEEAIRVVPNGKQVGLASTSLRGMVQVDAKKHSFFKHVIEQRAANESNLSLHYWLKILANSGSYGLFVELNPRFRDSL